MLFFYSTDTGLSKVLMSALHCIEQPLVYCHSIFLYKIHYLKIVLHRHYPGWFTSRRKQLVFQGSKKTNKERKNHRKIAKITEIIKIDGSGKKSQYEVTVLKLLQEAHQSTRNYYIWLEQCVMHTPPDGCIKKRLQLERGSSNAYHVIKMATGLT